MEKVPACAITMESQLHCYTHISCNLVNRFVHVTNIRLHKDLAGLHLQ